MIADLDIPKDLLDWIRQNADALGGAMSAKDAQATARLIAGCYIRMVTIREPDNTSHFDIAYVAAGDMAMAIDVHVDPTLFVPLVPWALGEGRAEVEAMFNQVIDTVAAEDGTERQATIAFLPIRPSGGTA